MLCPRRASSQGNAYIYCPWDVLNYCRILKADSNAKPQKYWMNSSSNDIVGKFIDQIIASGDASVQEDFVKLAQGESVNKYVNSNITYKELYSSVDNMWSTLFMTGYLTSNDSYYEDRYNLTIPNLEIRAVVQEIFIEQFKNADTSSSALTSTVAGSIVSSKLSSDSSKYG